MFLETLIFTSLWTALAGGVAIAVVTYVVTRYWDHIVSWFRLNSGNLTRTQVPVTVAEEFRSGNYTIVQGIFDTESETFCEARRIKSEEADDKIKEIHSRNRVAVYS